VRTFSRAVDSSKPQRHQQPIAIDVQLLGEAYDRGIELVAAT
jgi:hypothetical protein